MSNLQSKALVVTLQISQWSGRKLDKKITEEVNKQHNATNDAGRYNKLLIDKKFTEPIQTIASRARAFHYENTSPWGDNNERLLSSDNYLNYIGEINKLKGDFEAAVSNFLSNYDSTIEDARRRLNGMFNEMDYPSRREIVDKFDFKPSFLPVPSNDFRVSLSDDEVDRLRSSVQTEINTRIEQAVKDTWNRVKDQLTKMRDKLADSESIFRDSLFENLRDLISLLPKLNVTDDVNIARVCNDMTTLLVEPDAVRNNVSLRSQKAQEVDQILNKFGNFFS